MDDAKVDLVGPGSPAPGAEASRRRQRQSVSPPSTQKQTRKRLWGE